MFQKNFNQLLNNSKTFYFLLKSAVGNGGGYFSTVDDMSKYILAHLNQGESNGVNILNATTIDLMLTDIAGSKLGLGWWVRQTYGSRNDYQGHPGGPHNGFFCLNYIRKSLGVVLFINKGVGDILGFNDIYTNIFDLAHKLLTEKTPITTAANFYLYILLILIAAILIFRRIKKR